MDKKKPDGTTYLAHIHHRQTPMRIMSGLSNVGPVWVTEAEYQSKRNGDKIGMGKLPEGQNQHVTYTARLTKDASHPEAAKAFIGYMMSESGQAVITHYGFEPAPAD
ncbi:molybdate ABC transporter substrate-binding protein [Roseovarius sp. S1116L3]|uniref:molybdate ABC transporter substrate-binding protein n=1 Tax=Roseovarius roseus TaxID=3342636 RepID=UPI003729DB3A